MQLKIEDGQGSQEDSATTQAATETQNFSLHYCFNPRCPAKNNRVFTAIDAHSNYYECRKWMLTPEVMIDLFNSNGESDMSGTENRCNWENTLKLLSTPVRSIMDWPVKKD